MTLLTLRKYEKRALGLVSQDFGLSGLAIETNKKRSLFCKEIILDMKTIQKKSINSEISNGIYMSTFRGLDTLKII